MNTVWMVWVRESGDQTYSHYRGQHITITWCVLRRWFHVNNSVVECSNSRRNQRWTLFDKHSMNLALLRPYKSTNIESTVKKTDLIMRMESRLMLTNAFNILTVSETPPYGNLTGSPNKSRSALFPKRNVSGFVRSNRLPPIRKWVPNKRSLNGLPEPFSVASGVLRGGRFRRWWPTSSLGGSFSRAPKGFSELTMTVKRWPIWSAWSFTRKINTHIYKRWIQCRFINYMDYCLVVEI